MLLALAMSGSTTLGRENREGLLSRVAFLRDVKEEQVDRNKNRRTGNVRRVPGSRFIVPFRLGDSPCTISLLWAFTTYRAAEVLNELWRLNDDWVVNLDDAVAVYRDRHGNLRYRQPWRGGCVGRPMGPLLGGLIAAPFTAGERCPSQQALAGGTLGIAAALGRRLVEEISASRKIFVNPTSAT